MDQLAQYRNELLPLHLNFERLQSTIYAVTFQNRMAEIVFLVQQVKEILEPDQGKFSNNNNDRVLVH